jgi:hypothetical protein|tara:strand:- start:612 stop:1190 length:579 start_codon:yes stop_codon:yes gene_type:complete
MADVSRQPTKLDYASPTQFRFGIHQLPKVEFFTMACNLPGINMGDAIFPTPFKDIPVMGDRITYENLEITFIVDEFLENYRSIHEWMTAIGFPKDRKQFSNFRANKSNTPENIKGTSLDIGDVQPATSVAALFSDANLIVLSNKNNPILEVMYRNMYPVALSSLQYTQDAVDVQYLTATASFSYQIYEFSDI